MVELPAPFPFYLVEEAVITSIGDELPSSCSQEHTVFTLGLAVPSFSSLHVTEMGGESHP